MSTRRAALSALVPLLLTQAAAHADTCDAVKAQIDARIRGNGIANFTLNAVEAAASAPGRVVGNCAGGAKKILMTGGSPGVGAAAGSPAAASNITAPAVVNVASRQPTAAKASGKPADDLLTECNDGSMSVGGSCKK